MSPSKQQVFDRLNLLMQTQTKKAMNNETENSETFNFDRELNPSKLLSNYEVVKELEKELMMTQMARSGMMNIADVMFESRGKEICRVACMFNEVNRELIALIARIRQGEL